jgi:hypothetical protein
MADSLGGEVRAFDNNANPPAAQALTLALVQSPGGIMPIIPGANLVRIWVDITGTACDGLDVQLTPSKRRQTSIVGHRPVPVVNSISGGIMTQAAEIVRRDFGATLTNISVPFDIPILPDCAYIVAIARRGGGVGTLALATAEFYSI